MGRRSRRRGRPSSGSGAGGGPGTEVELRGSSRRPRPRRDAATRQRSASMTISSRVPGNAGSRARSRTSAGGSSGSASDGILAVSASQIGKFVMTGPAVASSGLADRRPSGARAPRTGVAVSRDAAAEGRQQRDREQERAEDAERRPEPGDRPGPALARARAGRSRRRGASSADTMISTLTGPEAWRNVPQVVATGKSRPVTRNVMIDRMRTGRRRGAARLPRQREQADERDRQARRAAGR